MQRFDKKFGSNGIHSNFTKNLEGFTIFYNIFIITNCFVAWCWASAWKYECIGKDFTPLWLRTHDDRRAIFTYSANGSSSNFNSSPIFYSSVHRAPHIMALNFVTQMRIVYIFSLTMMDGWMLWHWAELWHHYRALHYSNRTTPSPPCRRHHRRHCRLVVSWCGGSILAVVAYL